MLNIMKHAYILTVIQSGAKNPIIPLQFWRGVNLLTGWLNNIHLCEAHLIFPAPMERGGRLVIASLRGNQRGVG